LSDSLQYILILNKYFEEKRLKNPAFSIGSYGRLFGISPSRMGEILKGKVGISIKRAIEISNKLSLSEEAYKVFILSVMSEQCRNPSDREKAKVELNNLLTKNQQSIHYNLSFLNSKERSIYNYFSLVKDSRAKEEIIDFFCYDVEEVHCALRTLQENNLIIKIHNQYKKVI
jgi:plasmid maintenance system antidote protein VapI